MPSSPRDWILIIVAICGLAWYYYSLISLGRFPQTKGPPPTLFRQFQSLSITTISGTLATFIGMLLGLKVVSANLEAQPSVSSGTRAAAIEIHASLSHKFQWWAAGLYVLSILVALYFWRKGGEETDSAISNLAKSLLGLIAGVLAIVLNIS